MMLSRRAWLGGAAAMAGALLLPRGRSALAATAMATSAPKIDVHVHLAGTGAGDSGCWISPAFRRRYTFRAMRFLYGITAEQMERSADEAWAEMVAERVAASELDYAVALGFDGVYDRDGELDRERSQMIVPPSWVFRVCARYPHLLPGPSLNPFRKDAMQRLEECIEAGAVLIKWLPLAQGIDPASPDLREFYEVLSRAGIPLLIHMGGERTFATVAPEMNNVRLLAAPLEAGVPVICAHSATRIVLSDEPDQLPLLRDLLRHYPHLWVDNSGLANPGRFPHLPKLAQEPLFQERTLYGSDFPVPSNAVFFLPRLGVRGVWGLEREKNSFDRDIAIKRRFGYPEETLTRAASVLPKLERWGVQLPLEARENSP
ncbi:amidohydrolase family protein [soil metagenome]